MTTWEDLVENAIAYLRGQQSALKADFEIGRWQRYDFRQDGTLEFSTNGVVHVIADMAIVGTLSSDSGIWQWSWDNDSIEPQARQRIDEIRTLGEQDGFSKLTSAKWPGDSHDAWEMTAIASHLLKSEGAYRSPGDVATYMILWNVRWAEPKDGDDEDE